MDYTYVVHFTNGDFTHVTAYSFETLCDDPGTILFTDDAGRSIRYERDVVKIIGA